METLQTLVEGVERPRESRALNVEKTLEGVGGCTKGTWVEFPALPAAAV